MIWLSLNSDFFIAESPISNYKKVLLLNPAIFRGDYRTDQREFYQLLTYTDDVDLHAKLAEWEAFYNYHRPHGGLGGKTPYERLIEKMR